MKMWLQSFVSLLTRCVFGFLVLFAMLVLSTTKVYSQTEWTKCEDNPLLGPGPSGVWDDESIIQPSVLFDGTTYHIWYTNMVDGIFVNLGYATSPDGIIWTKYDDPTTTTAPYAESDPVFNPGEPGEWDDETVGNVSVLLLDNIYYMWYAGSGELSLSGPSSIGRATSTDGINWVKDTVNNPVLTPGKAPSWDDEWICHPHVLFDGTIYHMWYNAYGGDLIKIGHATSPDGIIWTKDAHNPVLIPGVYTSWDYPRAEMPSVIYDGTTFHMWYTGGAFLEWRIGYATSPDGSDWTKYDHNPVLDWGEAGSWDDSAVAGCSVIFDTATYKMWFQGIDVGVEGHIGYATSTPTGIDDNFPMDLPRRFILSQNYPNPFNPSTKISYQLPKSSFVKLSIYDIGGKLVETLVDQKQNAGYYSIRWDANHYSSGVYIYRIQVSDPANGGADGFQQVKKCLLIK